MPENRHVLYFSTQFPNLRSPSMGVFSLQRVRALRRAGCEVLVVSPLLLNPPPGLMSKPTQAYKWINHQAQLPSKTLYEGVSAYYPKWICPPKQIFGWTTSYFLFLQVRNLVIKLAKAFKPDVILSSWLPDAIAASKLGNALKTPVLAIADGTDVNVWSEEYRGWSYARNNLNEKLSTIIFVSEALRDVGISKGLYGKKNIVLNNAVDVQLFTPDYTKRNEDVFTILSVGRLLPNKGYHILLNAFAEFTHCLNQPAHLILVGEGPMREELVKQTKRLGIQPFVDFVDPMKPEKLVGYYQQADLFCHPSLSEGFPCVVVEAMACGKPVVASHVGGIAEAVDLQSGILVPPGDTKALSQALLQAMCREWDCKIIRNRIVNLFSFEKWADTMLHLMDSVLAKPE